MKFTKLKSAEQPTTPKPTTTLPDNMTWAWDPKANQWIAVMKDNPVVTPPTYNPNNITNTSTTTQMYTPIKATKIKKVKAEELTKCEWCGEEYEDSELEDTELGKLCHRCKLGIESKEGPLHKKSTLIDSLNQFLDGDRYSREIKIEKGLISDGLIKLAGINPIKGPKYSITDKGLNLLKQAAQEEYDFEKDYIKAKKSYLLDGITESEFKTGAPESQGQMPKFSIFEKDGSELAQIEAKNSTDAKVKFFMENPEYEGSQSIEVKEIDSAYGETTTQGLDFPNQSVSPSTDIKVNPNGWVNMASDENIDKKQTILKNLVYQHNKQNGEESAIGLSLDFDNKAVATGDLESLSKLEDQLRDEEIHCNITPRKDFPEMYELTVFYNTKGAPTDKFAALKKKASEPLKFVSSKNIDFYIEEKDTLVKLVSEKLGIELDPKRIDFDYSLDYNLNSEIEWSISFEMREYGIKNMNINILNSTINLEVEYKPNNESAPIQENKFIRIDYPLENIEIIRGDDEIYNSIWLKKIEIKDGYCEVTF